MEPYLRLNLITLFAIIENLFNQLKDIFSNLYQKKYTIEKFQDLKMGASSFNDFYSEFIYLALDLKYIMEMLIWKFKYKLITHLQDWLNSGIALPTFISALAKRCLSIYEQMQVTDKIRDRTKPYNTQTISA